MRGGVSPGSRRGDLGDPYNGGASLHEGHREPPQIGEDPTPEGGEHISPEEGDPLHCRGGHDTQAPPHTLLGQSEGGERQGQVVGHGDRKREGGASPPN